THRSPRHLPDLCLIALFKQLPPNDQLVAARMSRRCAILVRAANRRLKMLAIASFEDIRRIELEINAISLSSEPAMKLTNGGGGGGEPSFPDYPLTTYRISKWNCLQVDRSLERPDIPTIELLVYIFSAVTDLAFLV